MERGESFPEGARGEVFRSLDAAVSCTICYSLMDVPLMLRSCGHSFCSACIRPNLEFQERKGQPCCPSCRKPCDARDLQANVTLRDTVDRYRAARLLVLELLREEQARERRQQREEAEEQAAAAEAQQEKEQGKLRRGAKRTASGGAASRRQQQQQQPSGDQRSKLRPRPQQPQQQPQSAGRQQRCGKTPGGCRGKDSGPSKAQAGRKRRRRAGGSQHSGSGSDFVVEIDDSGTSSWEEEEVGEEKEEESRGSQGAVEAIDLVDSDSSGSDLGLSDAESLSPPAKRVRRQAGTQQGQHGLAAAVAAGGGGWQVSKMPRGHPPRSTARQKQQQVPQQTPPKREGEEGEGSADGAPVAPPDTPTGFVRCPICSKTVPEFYINSHIDTCLAGGGTSHAHAGSKQLAAGRGGQGMHSSQDPAGSCPGPSQHLSQSIVAAAAASRPPQPFVPLAVPAKLVPSLTTDKGLRGFLAKYGLPTDGKKKDMLERYNALRLAVETANDRQERTSYAALARHIMIMRQRAMVGPPGAMAGALLRMQQPQQPAAGAPAVGPAGDSSVEAAAAAAPHTFKALIAGIRARKAAKKAAQEAAAGPAAGADPASGGVREVPQQHLQQQQQGEQEEEQGQGGEEGQQAQMQQAAGSFQEAARGHDGIGAFAAAGSQEGEGGARALADAALGGGRKESAAGPAEIEQAQRGCVNSALPLQAGQKPIEPPMPPQQQQRLHVEHAIPALQQSVPSALSMLHHQCTPGGAELARTAPAPGSAPQQRDVAGAPPQAARTAVGCSQPACTPQPWGRDHLKEQLPPNSGQARGGDQPCLGQASCQAGARQQHAHTGPLCQQQQQFAAQHASQAVQVAGGQNAMMEVLSAQYATEFIPDSDDDW